MKKKTGILIIVLSGLSILGVIISQVFWMVNAYKLRNDQFEDKIQVGLKTVVNNLYSLKNSHLYTLNFEHESCAPMVELHNESPDFKTLDSLLTEEFKCIKISKDYVFGIVKRCDSKNELIGGITNGLEKEIFNSSTQVSLTCLYNHDDPYYLVVYFLHKDTIIFKEMIVGFIISLFLLLIIGGSFIYIIYVSFRQKRISLIKNDFVNNMTHEFKTPISTVSLSAEMLMKDEILSNTNRAKKYVKVIFDENQRLKHQVEQVLQIAVIDKGEFKIKKNDLDVHHVVADIINKYEISIVSRGGAVKTYLEAKYPKIWADKMHFTNIIGNLLDNANKYTPDAPVVILRTKNNANGILISVEDNGIGIKSENLSDIFRQFHRVHTGNLHDVKGFGLGLYYVKLMTEAHGGYVKLSSVWGKGSTFELFFPFNNE